MTTAAAPSVTVPFGAWYGDDELRLTFPAGWQVHLLSPDGADEISEAQIETALAAPCDAPALTELARGRHSAVIAIDDLTRPTPVHRFLSRVLDTLHRGGIARGNVCILFGTAAHRPMDREEMVRKVGHEIYDNYRTVMHDFTGPDVRFAGWVEGGPVYLNRYFLDADLRIVVGGVIPHGETGFGGGAKMVVPGLAGRHTIAHFHGAFPPRPAGTLEAATQRPDRRTWSEAVARRIGVHWAICATVNARRQLAGLHCGDIVAAHRRAARQARKIGRTPVRPEVLQRATVAVVNAYPLDTDPIQMGKSISLVRKLGELRTIVVNAASDGVFYHGMGMGSGVSLPRLLGNLPAFLTSPRSWRAWFAGVRQAFGSLELLARTCYFSLNHLAHAKFTARTPRLATAGAPIPSPEVADPLAYSRNFPAGGFARKYPKGCLFREWEDLCGALARTQATGVVLVFPCAPLQLVDVEPE